MKKINLAIFCLTVANFINVAVASEIDKNTAQMQAMDKITGRVSLVNIPVNSEFKFGSLSVVVRACKTRPAEETPENFAFADITDKTLKGEEFNIFKGWMLSSSPATHAVEHPIYDIWLLKCIDTEAKDTKFLSEEDLARRDELPMKRISQENIQPETTEEKVKEEIPEMEYPDEAPQVAPELNQGEVEFSVDEEAQIGDESESVPENFGSNHPTDLVKE